MAVRAFWERKATMFAAALQHLLALRVKASPVYEHVRENRGEVFITASSCLEYVFFSSTRSVEDNCAFSTYSYKRAITVRTKPL